MGMQIDGIAASQAVDTSAERIDIAGLDISSLKAGQGMYIYEHRHPEPKRDEHGNLTAVPATVHDLLGAILFAKKIMGPEDCDDERQSFYWEQVGLPFLYVRGELFDSDGHDAARGMAAIIRFYHRNGIPCVMRYSIDGHTLERKDQELKSCVARDIAITAKPCNHSCISGVVKDPKAHTFAVDEVERHRENGTERMPGVEFTMKPFDEEMSKGEDVVGEWAAFDEIQKAMTAGSYNQAPGGLHGGAALAKEDVDSGKVKNRLRAAVRDWDRKGGLREHLTKTMSDVNPEFLQKFVDVLESKILAKAGELHAGLAKRFLAGGIDEVMKGAEDATGVVSRPAQAPPPTHTPAGTKIENPNAGPKAKFQPMDDDDAPGGGPTQAAIDAHVKGTQAILAGRGPEAPVEPGALSQPLPGATQIVENPHVPGLRVGLHPGEAVNKDNLAAAIRRQAAAMRQPAAPAPAVKSETSDLTVAVDDLQKDDKSGAPKPTATGAVTDHDETPKITNLTFRGQPVPIEPGVKKPTFDGSTGMWHTPIGSLRMSIPSKESPDSHEAFQKALNMPMNSRIHSYALNNWKLLHEMAREGHLPEDVVGHAVLFSQMSPNTAVPMQELMYAHMVDYLRDTGQKHSDPSFPTVENHKGWLERDKPQGWPKLAPEHWDRIKTQLQLKNPSEATGRAVGDTYGFQMAGVPGTTDPKMKGKWGTIARYPEIHDMLVSAVARNKHDARKTVEEMMAQKAKGGGQGLPGLAPKTLRYALGMMGMGNVVVPDTHFVRHILGLDLHKDGPTIDYMKQAMWNRSVQGVQNMAAMDKYYFDNHDAVKHILEHPEHGKFFKDHPESAIFPAFWKHWMAIVPHEQLTGLPNEGQNELTDHMPYWHAVFPGTFAKSEAGEEQPMFHKTAALHYNWTQKHGETLAAIMYYAYLVPHLINSAKAKHILPPGSMEPQAVPGNPSVPPPVEQMQKAEPDAATMDIKGPAAEAPPPAPVFHNGAQKQPGVLRFRPGHPMAGKDKHIIKEASDHYVAMAHDLNGFIHIPKSGEHKDYDVVSKPAEIGEQHIVGPQHISAKSAHVGQLIHGLDLSETAPKEIIHAGVHSASERKPFMAFAPGGGRVFVKHSGADDTTEHTTGMTSAAVEALYHNMAPHFGLQDHVPTTVAFIHPKDGDEHSAQSVIDGEHLNTSDVEHNANVRHWHDSGISPKIATMDYVMGNNDRHRGNFLMDAQGRPQLIDNGFSLDYHNVWGGTMVSHQPVNRMGVPWSPADHQWIKSLDAEKIFDTLVRQGVNSQTAGHAMNRLRGLQETVAAGKSLTYDLLKRRGSAGPNGNEGSYTSW